MIKYCILHLRTVTIHRWRVFKLCCRVGLPWRGLVHDLSKYSPTEFWEGVKYYQGNRSPILACKEDKGYSKAWLHHIGRNKHHPAYWYDAFAPVPKPIIPYKYVAEMICDIIAASMTYNSKDWTEECVINCWNIKKEKTSLLNPKLKDVLREVFEMVAVYGIKFLSKKNIQAIYDKHVNETEDQEKVITK